MANEPGEKQTPQSPATQDATRDQQAQQPVILAAALLVVLVFVVLVPMPFCTPVANEAGEKQTPHPTATQDAARDQ
jgi:hypothetical protein